MNKKGSGNRDQGSGNERKAHPILKMPKNVGTFLVDCIMELENAVKEHPYFADTFQSRGATIDTTRRAVNAASLHLEDWVRYGFPVKAADVFEKVMAKATLAWFEGNRAAFTKYMAQSIAVQIRAWQLGLKTMQKGGAK